MGGWVPQVSLRAQGTLGFDCRACCRYERLQKIMILSAIKRTPARLKFWFIKNYMSPQVGLEQQGRPVGGSVGTAGRWRGWQAGAVATAAALTEPRASPHR